MSKFILGKKLKMSQLFSEDGVVTPVTLIGVQSNVVVQIKNKEKDGYEAVQLGSGNKKNIAKAQKGHLKNYGNLRHLKEFRLSAEEIAELKEGDKIDVSTFAVGDTVRVSGVSKGKGFAGAVKRHGFSGMPSSHGHKSVKRHIGSIGQRFPQHTLRGKRMAGHMGNENLTVRGLKVVMIDSELGILALKGAVPGSSGSLVKIQIQN